jgi:hypothetical protein
VKADTVQDDRFYDRAAYRERADELLAEIAEAEEWIGNLESAFEQDVEALKARYGSVIEAQRARLETSAKTLVRLMKAHKGALFAAGDKVGLPHGFLIREKGWKVRIPRGTVEKLEALGWKDGLKIAKSLDREKIEKWDGERLAAIGATKKPSEEFGYEVKRGHQ